jgi:hypothetical protein
MKKEVRQKRIGTVERKKEEPCDGELTPQVKDQTMDFSTNTIPIPQSCLQKMIGPLTMKQRHEKIMKYIIKKRSKG